MSKQDLIKDIKTNWQKYAIRLKTRFVDDIVAFKDITSIEFKLTFDGALTVSIQPIGDKFQKSYLSVDVDSIRVMREGMKKENVMKLTDLFTEI